MIMMLIDDWWNIIAIIVVVDNDFVLDIITHGGTKQGRYLYLMCVCVQTLIYYLF